MGYGVTYRVWKEVLTGCLRCDFQGRVGVTYIAWFV